MPQDPRISDDDGDGHPGVTATIKIKGLSDLQIYLARLEDFAYEMRLFPDGSLRGHVIDRSRIFEGVAAFKRFEAIISGCN